ncbi:hypothetical protein CAPTEDRAFT_216562 [Capitella teleta]|uniref:Uncharacterized protein n=1 Tax=Capitella teleta TaxID=283909 RepID=R7T9Q1_CAPTE|nr:hypothetical protein CAPTEDRAFT_216562 [Capitella teleta]|eukprot:ELT90424.1 hypothetical protein CAPTEDRAFT_216562 [Capitella teleta]
MPFRPPLGRLLLERLAWLLRLPTPRPLPTLSPQLRSQPTQPRTPRMLVKTPSGKWSLIDHICMSSEIADQVIEYRCIHRVDNLSDNKAVVLTLQLDGSLERNDCSEPRNRSSLSWSKASENDLAEYKRVLSLLLAGIQLPEDPLRCITLCNNNNHSYLIETYSVSISNACIAAAEVCIPKTNQRRCVAGWSEHVQQLKASSIMWHTIWEECGWPFDGVVAETAEHAKHVYKQMVKWVLSHQNELSNFRKAEAMTRGEINNVCQNGNCYCNHSKAIHDVKAAICKLKRGKFGGSGNPTSDHTITAPLSGRSDDGEQKFKISKFMKENETIKEINKYKNVLRIYKCT